MKTTYFCSKVKSTRAKLIAGIPALLVALPLYAQRDGHHESRPAPAIRSAPAPVMRPAPGGSVQRFNHGTVRHSDSHVFQAPAPTFHGNQGHFEGHNNFAPQHDVFVHRDVDVDFHHPHFWNNFVFHQHLPALPLGFLTLNIGGAPYYYSDGIYYQPAAGGFQEVYPPVGAAVPQPPDGSIQVYAGGQTYYYAGGAFYVQQPDGQFAIAPTPIGVVVPELPPGATEVNVNGQIAYQFNGIYYQPIFVNGVTQYQTFMP
jgi:hypothetical protein